jgi:putative tryptophan/tyrosine transport system ATP-binding protein
VKENEIMLKLTNISKTFNAGTITEKKAIIDVSLELHEGDFVTVIGGNGAGKSTLLNLIAGVSEVDSGRIYLDNIDVTEQKEHVRAKHLGRVFQDPMLGTASNMEIEENLAIALRRGKRRTLGWGISREEREMYQEKLLTLDLGLETRMKNKVGLLSGGQRQALTLLMATIKKPRLLLLDEHTAALDPKTAKKVLELTDEIVARDNLTTFMVTHNMKDAIKHGNRLIMMNAGRIIYDVSGDEKKNLQVADLMKKFETVNDEGVVNDRMLLG